MIPFVDFLLNTATRRRKASELNLPDSPTLKRVLTARGGLTPISTDTDYDPDSVNITERPTQPLIPGLEQRPRQVQPPTQLEKAQQQVDYVNSADNHGLGGSILEKHGRARSFLEGFLGAAGQRANAAMAQGNVGWGGVAQALGGGLGGGGVYAIQPEKELKARHEQARAQAQAELDQALQNETNAQRIEVLKSQNVARDNAAAAKDRDLNIKEQGMKNRDEYYDESLKLRQAVLDNKISFDTWKKEQADLDRKYKYARLDETVRHNETSEGVAQQNAESNRIRANRPPAGTGNPDDAYARAEELQRQINDLDAQDKSEPSFNAVIDSKTGQSVTDARGNIVYSNKRTEAYKERQARKKSLTSQKEKLYAEARKSSVKTSSTPTPQGQRFSVRAWKSANPQGDVNAAIAKAKRLGYVVTD